MAKMAKEAKLKGIAKTKSDSTKSPSKAKVAAKLRIPSPPTSPEVSPSPSPVPDEIVEEIPVMTEIEKIDPDSPDWPKDDDMDLFQRIQKALPADDSMKYESRLNHIDWETVAFDNYSSEDCKKRWHYVQTHLRRYRLLTELVVDAMSWRLRPWTNFNASRKAQTHPEHPKKPLSAYLIFYMDKKNEVMISQPGLAMIDMSKVIAKMYSTLSDKKKSKYTELAKKEKEQYEIKLKKFLQDHPDYVPLKSSGAPIKAVAPKPPTPYKLYCDAMMTKFEQEGLHNLEAKHKCLDTFKELSDKSRLKWIYLSLQQENQYLEEVEKFKLEHPDVVNVRKSLLSKEEQALKDKTEGKPLKPPNSGYSLFSQKLLASDSLKNVESKNRMFEISRQWKELDDEIKNKYKLEALELINVYKMKYASYLESLEPLQRAAELVKTNAKTAKRSNNQPKQKDQPEEKKSKLDSNSSENGESDNSEKDFQQPKPSKAKSIQKPNSSLQMFCDANMDKYKKKHSGLIPMELARYLAKAFSKLSSEEKQVYEIMAMQSKAHSTVQVKKAKKSAVKESSSTKTDKKSSSKTKSKTKTIPIWGVNQRLYENEPPRPPQNVAEYYAYMKEYDMTLPEAALEERWDALSKKQKDKYTQKHQKELQDYVVDFENFIRSLPSGDLKPFRAFMSERDRNTKNGNNEVHDVEDEHSAQEEEEEVRLELEVKSSSEEDEAEKESSGESSDQSSEDEDWFLKKSYRDSRCFIQERTRLSFGSTDNLRHLVIFLKFAFKPFNSSKKTKQIQLFLSCLPAVSSEVARKLIARHFLFVFQQKLNLIRWEQLWN